MSQVAPALTWPHLASPGWLPHLAHISGPGLQPLQSTMGAHHGPLLLVLYALTTSLACAENSTSKGNDRAKKALSVFTVVKVNYSPSISISSTPSSLTRCAPPPPPGSHKIFSVRKHQF